MLRVLDEHVLADLEKSILANGLLQPILVRPISCFYEVVFGHHRLEACKRLGWNSIPAIIKEMSTGESFLTQVVENLQRNGEINPLTEANGYIDLIDHGWTINRIAKRIGKSDSYVSDRVGLIRRLDPEIARKFNECTNGHLKASHLELLARMKSSTRQREVCHLIELKRLSVRKLEKMISGGQPLIGTVEKDENTLYIRVPQEIARVMKIDVGDSVCMYLQSRRRLAIERFAG
jgi:ParB family chromosome partitioning protein